MMATMFAKEYIDQAHIEAEAEARRKLSQEINENFEKGKTDDYALKKAILSLCEIIVLDTNFDPFIYVVEDMTRMEIPRERQKQGLENIIREILVVAEKDEKNEELSRFYIFVKMLGMFPDYNLLPILEEGIKSKNDTIREDAQAFYNAIMDAYHALIDAAKGDSTSMYYAVEEEVTKDMRYFAKKFKGVRA